MNSPPHAQPWDGSGEAASGRQGHDKPLSGIPGPENDPQRLTEPHSASPKAGGCWALYCRSNRGGDDAMQTLNAQEATLRALAAARGATVCGAWLEIGPGPGSAYHAMIQHLRGNGCARVAIYDLGRLTRDPNEFQLVMELLAELGIGLTLADGTDLDTADDPVLRLRLYGFAPRKARLAPGSNW